LPRLDLVREVVVGPAPVAQIADLQLDLLCGLRSALVHVLLEQLLFPESVELMLIVVLRLVVGLHFPLKVSLFNKLPARLRRRSCLIWLDQPVLVILLRSLNHSGQTERPWHLGLYQFIDLLLDKLASFGLLCRLVVAVVHFFLIWLGSRS